MKGDTALREFQGRDVNVALDDGSRLDGCQLMSADRARANTVWLFVEGSDVFVPLARVVAVWDVHSADCYPAR